MCGDDEWKQHVIKKSVLENVSLLVLQCCAAFMYYFVQCGGRSGHGCGTCSHVDVCLNPHDNHIYCCMASVDFFLLLFQYTQMFG